MSSLSHDSLLKWLQLLAVCLTGLLIPLSFTGPAVALASIGAALGGSPSQLGWVMNAYILSYGSAMMVAGSLTDIYGRRRLWLLGLAWFAASSLAVGMASQLLWADLLRLLQGLGGAVAFAAAMSSLAPLFEGAARARAFSLLGTTFGLGLAFGPWVSGAIVDGLGWRWVFHATGLVALLALPMVWVGMRGEARAPGGRPDWLGALSFTLALGGFTYGMLLVPERGWAHGEVLASLAASAALLAVFVAVQRRTAQPLLDLALFTQRGFLGVQVLAASPAFLFISLVVMLPGRFIGVDGFTPLEAGRMMGWLAAPLLVVPVLAASLSRWVGPGRLSAAGLLLAAAGLGWLAVAFGQGPGMALAWPLLLIGVGIGLPWGLMDGLAVSTVAPERVGMATGIFNTVRISADGVALAVTGAVLAILVRGRLGALEPGDPALRQQLAGLIAQADLARASQAMPGHDALFSLAYGAAFHDLLLLLAGLAVATALTVLWLLERGGRGGMARPTSPAEAVRGLS
ncbi:Spectinomycin tetracycline efflux pump [Delftia tsuruhatensis]|uniref:MFS transporter n=1 Tax=Delftia tsuruhatensis TaxID=180282 RepID=UPI001E6FB4E3|nr:MFS transporter [Delftia tsuruhatensis]CAB5722346.1 Spectinomycin tetracycline efflux pump [Delftia tsuruhatensis]CAC9682325.1 Spectinomycin tetracycline efflux pump [Delftia tsuruhatensis]